MRAMRSSRRIRLLLLATAIGSAPNASAAPPDEAALASRPMTDALHTPGFELVADPALSLGDLVVETAEREPGHWLVDARQADAKTFDRAASRWLSDRASATGGFITDAVGADDGYSQWDALLELPLWWPGQRSSRRSLARAARASAAASTEAHLLETAGLVRTALAALAITRNRESFALAEWQTQLEWVAQVRRAVELGETAEIDLLLAERECLEREIGYREASEEARHAEESYRILTGRETHPSEWEEAPAGPTDIAAHPLLRQAHAEITEAEAALQVLDREQWGAPTVALGGQGERADSSTPTSNRLVTLVRIPLGRGTSTDFERVAIRRRVALARRDAGRLERILRERRAAAEHQLELAVRRAAVGTDRERIADQRLELTERGHALGELDVAALMGARIASLEARRAAREAEILHALHVAEWNQSLGVIP